MSNQFQTPALLEDSVGASGGGLAEALSEAYPAGAIQSVGVASATGFPKRAFDPYRWSWDGATMTLTIGNIMLYTPNGTLTTKVDDDTVLAAGDHYFHLTYTHDGGAIDIGVAVSLAAAQTDDADRAAGIQKIPLYHFTVTGTACVCAADYIHHGAVGTIYR